MRRMFKMKLPKQITVSSETLLEYLHLPTVDDTQTAFAKIEIFISETTAAKWRKLVNEDGVDAIQSKLPKEEEPPHCMERLKIMLFDTCWNQKEPTFRDNLFV